MGAALLRPQGGRWKCWPQGLGSHSLEMRRFRDQSTGVFWTEGWGGAQETAMAEVGTNGWELRL